jgi:hypothetical protein
VAAVAVVAVAVAAVEVGACAAAAARELAAACVEVVDTAEAAVIAGVAATAAADSAARLRCRARPIVRHRSVDPVAAVEWPALDRATGTCQLQVGLALEVDRVPETSPAGRVVLDRALAVGRESVDGPVQAVAQRIATCKTFSIFRVVDMPVGVGLQPVPADLVPDLEPVRLPVRAVRSQAVLPQSFSAIVPASCRAAVAGQAPATSLPSCRLDPAVAAPTSAALANQAAVGRAISVGPGNQAIDPVTSAGRAHQAIGRPTLAGQAARAIVPLTLEDRVDPAIGPVTSAVQVGRETLAVPANPAETMSKTCQAELAIAKAGRTGVRSIATISATGGRTTPATSTIGSTIVGGTTTTSTIRTILGSVSGPVPLGAI